MLGVNSHLVVVRVLHVAASRRRRGVGSEMLRAVATSAGAMGYGSLTVWAVGEAETSFCEHHGLTHQTTERHSRLAISDVNAAEQDVWAAGEKAAAAGYTIDRHHQRRSQPVDARHQHRNGIPGPPYVAAPRLLDQPPHQLNQTSHVASWPARVLEHVRRQKSGPS